MLVLQKRFFASLLCSVLSVAALLPSSATAQDSPVATVSGAVLSVEGGLISASIINNHVVGSRLEQMRSRRRALSERWTANASRRPGAYGMVSPGIPDFQNGLWVAPFVTRHRVDERDGHASYRYKAVGSALGYDRIIGDFTLGGAFVYNRGSYKDKWVDASDNYALTLYGTYSPINNLFIDASGGYQYGKNKYKRHLVSFSDASGIADGDFIGQKNNTGTWWISAKTGYDFPVWGNLTLTPSTGLEYYNATGSAFTSRSRAPGVNNTFDWMKVDEIDKSALTMPLDLYTSYTFDINPCSSLSFRAGGGWDLALTRKAASGSMRYVDWNQKADIVGAKPGRNLWKLGFGAKYRTQRFDVSLDYRYDGGWKKAYAVSGALEVKF